MPKIPLPLPTEADFLAARAACITAMKPDWQERLEVRDMTPDEYTKSFTWSYPTHPNKSPKQLAAEAAKLKG